MEICQTEQYVTSGSPQGSVQGHILFVVYTNEINNNVPSPVRLFADDCIVYTKITSETDREIFQYGLIKLQACQMSNGD